MRLVVGALSFAQFDSFIRITHPNTSWNALTKHPSLTQRHWHENWVHSQVSVWDQPIRCPHPLKTINFLRKEIDVIVSMWMNVQL